MGDESVDLVKGAGIEEQLKAIARRELAAFALGIDSSLSAAKESLFSSCLEISPLVARLCRLVRIGVGRIGRDCCDLRVTRGDSDQRTFRRRA
jgi:hypothetical protein